MKDSKNNNPFKTPEGYFENFTDELLNALRLENLDLPKEDGFTVPEDYFDGLHKDIQLKLEPQETKVLRLHPYHRYFFAAASVAAVVLIFFGLNWTSTETPTFNELADTDIEAYFDNNELGLSSYEIAEMIPVDELKINDILETQLNDDNVVDYLYENTNDFEELNLEDYE